MLLKRGAQHLDVSGRACSTDSQCVDYRVEASGKHRGSTATDPSAVVQKNRLGEYACIDGACRYVVKAGELCFSANDCAAFQLNSRWEQADNTTVEGRLGRRGGASGPWCAPEFCTLEATCGGAWTLLGAPAHAPAGADSRRPITNGTISCCRGFEADAQCGLYSGAVDTCGAGYSCATPAGSAAQMHRRTEPAVAMGDGRVDRLGTGTPIGKCASQDPHQQVWIGVVLVLIGGATLNIGLNIQKYAFRKRQEKADADTLAAHAAASAAVAASRPVQSPSKPSEIVFYSTDQLSGKAAADLTVQPMRGFPHSADDIQSLHSPAHGPPVRPCVESIAETAAAANMSRVSLASHRTAAASAPEPEESRVRRWPAAIQRRLAARRRLQNTPLGSSVWVLGLVIFVLGNVVDFIALQFAPQSLVAPLGAVALVTNVIVAPLLNNEKIGLFDLGGIALIIAGCVIVVVFSGISQQNYRLCVLVQLLRAKPTVLFLCAISAAVLAIYLFLWAVERGVERYHDEYHPLDADAPSDHATADPLLAEAEPLKTAHFHRHRSSSSSSSGTGHYARSPALSQVHLAGSKPAAWRVRLRGWLDAAARLHPLYALGKRVRAVRPESRKVRYGLPLAYASLGSLMAALTTLFAKSLVNLLSASLFDHDNQFTNALSWAILLVTVFTAASQVYWINQGLLRYDAMLQVPVFYVVWTVFDIIGGGIYFNEFRTFTTVKYVMFVLGVAVIFSG
ncbi:hypothetical protein H4R19_003168, partial [Coemansia spiralis]